MRTRICVELGFEIELSGIASGSAERVIEPKIWRYSGLDMCYSLLALMSVSRGTGG